MLKYINDKDYKELLGVSSIPDNFNKYVIDASVYINSKTFNRIDIEDLHENVKYATALIIEKIADAEMRKKEVGNLKSQNIEGWSETYSSPEEIEKKLEFALKANLVIAIYNPISKTRKEPFRRFVKTVLKIKGENALIGIVDSTYEPAKETIVKIKDLTEDMVNMSCTLIVGNDLTYIQEDKLITPRGYVIKSKIHPLSHDHYEKFLNGEISHGPNRECEFYPCHYDGQYCDFCYCPFYPCGDSSTGGQWIKGKNVWNCKECMWVHEKEAVDCLRKPLEELLEETDDLKTKKKMLLKLRRACLLKNNPYDL